MDKNAIKKFAIWARRELISRVSQKALQYGISAEEHGNPDADSVNGIILTPMEKQQRRSLINKIEAEGYEQAMEEAAYTWFNRFTALRYMEVNGYLPSHVRVFTNEENAFKPQILAEAIHLDPDDFEGLDMEKIYAYKDANDTETLFKYLLIMQCNAFSKSLPGMFTSIMDFTVLLFPDNLLREGSVIEQMIAMIPEEDWKDQVQIIGWLYQYYNSEKKDAVFAAMSNKVKVSKENIAAATQLFTPDWIVRYMVENSLGRLWVDGHADTSARSEWKYYLDEAEQTPEVQAQLAEIRAGRKDLSPEQIRFIDPCMGSGHILVYAFDVLMQIYLSCGYTERDAAQNIVRNNLWGLDLDKRAYQLAYFAVMMKARQYDRRSLGRGIKPNLSHFQDLPTPNYSLLDEPIKSFVEQFENADTYGSLITVQADDEIDTALDVFQGTLDLTFDHMEHLMQLYKILSQRYDVVCTNPPYMGAGNMNAVLGNYLKNNYPISKFDLSTAFMERCSSLTVSYGYYSMINIPVWMSKSSFEELRHHLLISDSFINMLHCGRGIFGSDFGTTTFVLSKNLIHDYASTFHQLFDEMGAVDAIEKKEKWFFERKGRYVIQQSKLLNIASYPIAYSTSSKLLEILDKEKPLEHFAYARKGLTTGDNDRFIRLWFEVSSHNTSMLANGTKWFPMTKGGDFRRWYGNNEYVVNWENDGFEIRNFKDENGKLRSRPQNVQFYFREGISWNDTTATGKIAFRYQKEGYISNASGPCVFADKNLIYLFGLLNSIVSQKLLEILAPNMKFEVGQMALVPIVMKPDARIDDLVMQTVDLEKDDWDSFETSWDFKKHPFIRSVVTIKEAYEQWAQECNDRRAKLKANEEELNRIFIEIYGLQDELTPEVEDKDITVRAADLQRDMRSFVSYAVGCMFGRYSLDTEGLAYAGGEWDESKYLTFIPDKDNIIPICDDDYLSDDITLRFVEFVRTVFGEDTLEENLQCIASALGGKGTARDAIRSYFLNGFYADHCKIYQKRPIYWLFDSGKKNGFKALIYLHRYQPDTIARVRTGYVHELQARYRTAIEDLEKRVNAASGSEAVKLKKALTKLTDQSEELTAYEEIVHHLADQMIKIDLDDGVKHNYAIFKEVLAKLK